MCAWVSSTASMGGRSRTRTPGRRCRRSRMRRVAKTGSIKIFLPESSSKNEEWPIKVTAESPGASTGGFCGSPCKGFACDSCTRRQSCCSLVSRQEREWGRDLEREWEREWERDGGMRLSLLQGYWRSALAPRRDAWRAERMWADDFYEFATRLWWWKSSQPESRRAASDKSSPCGLADGVRPCGGDERE